MLQKYLTISVNARSLPPFIDELVRQGLVSQISNSDDDNANLILIWPHRKFQQKNVKVPFCQKYQC